MTVPARFIHVGFGFAGQVPDLKKLEQVFNAAFDWLRYSEHAWILYSNTELDTWRDRIRACPAIKSDDKFFLTEFQLGQYSGYQTDDTWNWLHKNR